MSQVIRFGSIGASGYASALINALDRWVDRDRAVLRAVDVSRSTLGSKTQEVIARHGAQMVQGVEPLMQRDDLDVMIVATSIDSHLPYTAEALGRGMHVHCEKPVTPTIQDAQAMIEARDKAGRFVAIGYHDTYSPSTAWAVEKIRQGAIGRVLRGRVMATWPRPDSYYSRNGWAGAIQRDGHWVLDSPANNALAHQINLLLYLSSARQPDSNRATAIRCELYRGRPDIENYDTFAAKLDTRDGAELLVLLTHAVSEGNGPVLEIIGQTGVLRRPNMSCCQLLRDGQVVETVEDGPGGTHGNMFANLLDRIEGKADRIKCEIENAAEVTRVINAASQCCPIQPINSDCVQRQAHPKKPDDQLYAVTGMESLWASCYEQFALPSEGPGRSIDWVTEARSMDMSHYDHFDGVAER